MTDGFDFSNDQFSTLDFAATPFDQSLAELEQALLRVERLLARYAQTLAGAHHVNHGFSKKSILNSILINIFRHALTSREAQGTIFNPPSRTPGRTNRYPASNGQLMADIVSLLQRAGGRNL